MCIRDRHGAKVILFEGKEVGGTCVNVGCVPKKVMWYGAQVAETLHRYAGEYGFDVTVNKFDFTRLKANRQAYIDRIPVSYTHLHEFDADGQDFSRCKTSFECWLVVFDCIDRSNNWWGYSKFRHGRRYRCV